MFLLFHFNRKEHVVTEKIYIPICFYYFWSRWPLDRRRDFIYIPICFYYFSGWRTTSKLYSSFTFQYVSIISTLPTNPYTILAHLHSNMFLLFHRMTLRLRKMTINLHSNMFLLFLENP